MYKIFTDTLNRHKDSITLLSQSECLDNPNDERAAVCETRACPAE